MLFSWSWYHCLLQVDIVLPVKVEGVLLSSMVELVHDRATWVLYDGL